MEFEVYFTPSKPENHQATLLVASSDLGDPRSQGVDLTGRGLSPWLVISPSPHDFGEATLGCSSTRNLVAQNVGNAPLELSAIDPVGNGDFVILSGPELPRLPATRRLGQTWKCSGCQACVGSEQWWTELHLQRSTLRGLGGTARHRTADDRGGGIASASTPIRRWT